MNTNVRILLWKIKRQPFVSIAIVAINLLVFILCMIFPRIYDLGYSGVYDVIINKEYGRIIWSMFLHADANHIFSNMVIVFFLGTILEQEIGHWVYGMIYFLSGIVGNVFSLLVKWVTNDWAVSLGASGATFGLDGLLIAMVILLGNRLELPATRVVFVVFLSLYSGFTSMGIDNAAHVGGLIVGFFLGMITCIIIRSKQK